jgi:hypothetical protein
LSLSKHAKLFGNSWAHAEYISDDDDFEWSMFDCDLIPGISDWLSVLSFQFFSLVSLLYCRSYNTLSWTLFCHQVEVEPFSRFTAL